jgi:hypothetical protein
MPTVAISIDLLSKMHAAIGAAKAYRSAQKEVAGYQSADAEIHAYEEREQLDLALAEYDRASAEVHHVE